MMGEGQLVDPAAQRVFPFKELLLLLLFLLIFKELLKQLGR